MYIEPNYVTNEVEGSFWRPDDYVQSVPNEHVIGKTGDNSTFQFQSEDGIVRKLQYNIHEGELNQTDFAV